MFLGSPALLPNVPQCGGACDSKSSAGKERATCRHADVFHPPVVFPTGDLGVQTLPLESEPPREPIWTRSIINRATREVTLGHSACAAGMAAAAGATKTYSRPLSIAFAMAAATPAG
jgi:hypothetical protein